MDIAGICAVVTGGASGLGRATVERLVQGGAARVVLADLASSNGEQVAESLGDKAIFVAADVRSPDEVAQAITVAAEGGPLRVVVHCAGRGGAVRVVNKDGTPGSLETYTDIVTVNLVGSFNVLRLAAAEMARNEPLDGDRGVVIMTASIAAYEGQIGQLPYASSKAGIVGMTIVAARDLATKQIRVCTIAPGTFDTQMLAKLPENMRASLGASIPHPGRLGQPDEFARLALAIVDNGMLNGETIRLDGALRMPPR